MNPWVVLLAFCFLILKPAQAEVMDFRVRDLLEILNAAQSKLDRFTKHNFTDCKKLPAAEAKDCLDFYKDLLAKDRVQIDYFLGYTNFDNEVVDKYQKKAMIKFLTKPCSAGSATQSCGFQRDPDDADTFWKEVTWPNGAKKKIEFRIVSSSHSDDDQRNRKSPLQILKSEEARKKFMQAVQTSDILIYDGHSRYGGGPDFYPERRKENGKHDIEYYRREKPGLKDLSQSLEKRPGKGPSLLMMASCDSEKHFAASLKKNPGRPKNVVLSSGTIGVQESLFNVAEVTDTILKGNCPSKMKLEKTSRYQKFQ